MKSILIAAIMLPISCFSQSSHKVTYKYNHLDGWIKITESHWSKTEQNGDITTVDEITEENNQEDPYAKPKYEFNGAGYRVVHDTIKQAPIIKTAIYNKPHEPVTPRYSFTTESSTTEEVNTDSVWTVGKNTAAKWTHIKGKNTKGNNYYHKGKTVIKNRYIKGKNTHSFKYANSKKKSELYVKSKPAKKVDAETSNFIEYKKRLWLVVNKSGEVTMIDSSNKTSALTKYKKLSSVPVLAIEEFFQSDIVHN